MDLEEDFSTFVCKVVNSMGYAWETIQLRREVAKLEEHGYNSRFSSDYGLSQIVAGSQREGSNTLLGGDHDRMIAIDEVIATEDIHTFEGDENLRVVKLDTDDTSPGYGRLVVKKHGGGISRGIAGPVMARFNLQFLISSCQVSDNGQEYLSSEIFFRTTAKMFQLGLELQQNPSGETLVSTYSSIQPRAGPSMPIIADIGIQIPSDNVIAIPCQCQGVLKNFLNRPRHNGWPPEDILLELSRLEAHVVPVGFKKSPNHLLEWRICFTKAEIRLIECLTEPQFYVFVLLKIFTKDVLKNIWGAMTSYMVKNVILWVVELTSGHRFRSDTVVDRFLGCLFFLKMCVKVGRLPSYMIPERNLLDLDQFVVKRPKLLSVLDDCLQEKGSCLMRSRKLKDAMIKMYTSPESAMEYGNERERYERAMLSAQIRVLDFCGLGISVQSIWRFIMSGNLPEMVQHIIEMYTAEDLEALAFDPDGVQNVTRRLVADFLSHLR